MLRLDWVILVAGVACVVMGCGGTRTHLRPSPAPRAVASPDETTVVRAKKPSQAPTAASSPAPQAPIAQPSQSRIRRGGDLVVDPSSPPATPAVGGRLRSHIKGSLSLGSPRHWVGPPVPPFVDLTVGTLELLLLDARDGQHLALYRDPYGASSCTLRSSDNCAYRVRLYGADGVALWTLDPAQLFSRQDHLEIQDVRYRDGVLYFNEACQSYSREARGRCSSLVAVEPTEAKVLWRTKPLVSNNRFLVEAELIVSGYGFTNEPDHLYVLRRTDGKVMHRLRIPKAHDAIARDDQGRLVVRLYPDAVHYFELYETKRGAPRLRPVGKR